MYVKYSVVEVASVEGGRGGGAAALSAALNRAQNVNFRPKNTLKALHYYLCSIIVFPTPFSQRVDSISVKR